MMLNVFVLIIATIGVSDCVKFRKEWFLDKTYVFSRLKIMLCWCGIKIQWNQVVRLLWFGWHSFVIFERCLDLFLEFCF